jgi:hypothetical protein
MYGIDFRTVFVPTSWASADNHFNEERQLRGVLWQENERPLRDKRAHHLRVVRNDDASYDLMLYQHTMVRYHKPTPTHFTVDVFMPWGGRANWSYIWQAGYGWGSTLRALRHEDKVWLHPYPSSEPEAQSAHLVFRADRMLDTTQSWQLQAFRYKYVDPERKNRDGFARERIRSLVILLAIAQNTYTPEYNRDYRLPIKHYDRHLRARAQINSEGLRSLRAYAAGQTEELLPSAAEGMTNWFKRTLDVRMSSDKFLHDEHQLSDQQIEDGLMRLMKGSNPGSEERVKVPVKMWRSGGNRPSRSQFFQTRAEAESAKARLTQLK